MFRGFSNVNGGRFNLAENGGSINIYENRELGELQGIRVADFEEFSNYVAAETFHDSGMASDSPILRSGTRDAILDSVYRWAAATKYTSHIQWIYGTERPGRSTLLRMAADMLAKHELLLATFSFAGAAGSQKVAKCCIPTIAYQVSQFIPTVRPYLELGIKRDPLVLSRTWLAQAQALIVQPIAQAYMEDDPDKLYPRIIIFDGLDDCEGKTMQDLLEVLEMLSKNLQSIAFLVATRPKPHILTGILDSHLSHSSTLQALEDFDVPSTNVRPDDKICQKCSRHLVIHPITVAYNNSPCCAVDTTEPLKDDDIVIAVMGPTGSGKSTFVAAMTKYNIETACSLLSCTSSVDMFRVPSRSPEKYGDLVFVDTPGFDDTCVSDVDILQLIFDWLRQSKVKLSGLLYFHRISDNRMAGTPLRNLRMFEKICGKDRFDSVILVTTMWDEVDESTGTHRERELVKKYWMQLMLLGSQTKRFIRDQERGPSRFLMLESLISVAAKKHMEMATSQSAERDRSLISQLFSRKMQKSPSNQTVLLQEEGRRGYELRNTSAGRELYSKLDLLFSRRRELLDRCRKEVDECKSEGDYEDLTSLMQELEVTQREVFRLSTEMQRMEVPMSQRLKRVLGRIGDYFTMFA